MNVGQLRHLLDGVPWELPVMIWCECLTGGHWHTVQKVMGDEDRVVLVLEPFDPLSGH